MTDVQAVALVVATLLIAGLGELLRRKQLREKYAALWLVVACLIVPLALFPPLLDIAADALSVADPVNLLLFVAVVFLLVLTVHLSWELSRLEEETRTLAEEVAILRLDQERRVAEQEGP